MDLHNVHLQMIEDGRFIPYHKSLIEKWNIPLAAYLESMEDCLTQKGPVPQWYVALENDEIVGGLGVIENDFHDRMDLTPNVCAVYTEKEKRCNGIAGALLHYVCMVQGNDEPNMTRMYIHRG